MNTEGVLSMLRSLLMAVTAYAVGKGWLTPADSGIIITLATTLGPVLVPFVMSAYAHWGVIKVPESPAAERLKAAAALAFVVGCFLLPFSMGGDARAADLVPTKAPRLVSLPMVTSAPLTMDGWSGFYGGFSVTGTGTGVNIADLGSITANGNALGLEAGWETWNGTLLFGARAGAAYDISNPGSVAAASFSDHAVWHAGIVFGGNLSKLPLFSNLPQPQFPALLANTIPYVAIEACGHRGLVGTCSSVGVEFLVPNSRLTGFMEYTNGQFGNHSNAPAQSTSTDNSVRLGGLYHF